MSARDKMIALIPELRSELEAVDAEIARLTEQRRGIDVMLKALTSNGHRPKPKKAHNTVAADTVQAIRMWLYDRPDFGHFTMSTLLKDEHFDIVTSTSSLSPALRKLHEQGFLTLVGTGRGGQKTYRVIR